LKALIYSDEIEAGLTRFCDLIVGYLYLVNQVYESGFDFAKSITAEVSCNLPSAYLTQLLSYYNSFATKSNQSTEPMETYAQSFSETITANINVLRVILEVDVLVWKSPVSCWLL
jgi:hypothetical protein